MTSKTRRKPAPTVKRAANPLLTRWTTPFGVPPFGRVEPKHFKPAFTRALAEHRAEIRRIAAQKARPTFTNTIVALEKGGALLHRVSALFFNLAGAHTNDEIQAVEREMAPKLANHSSAIYLDAKLFGRIDDLYARRLSLGLDAEQLRLLDETHKTFVRAGAKLSRAAKKRVVEINAELATLSTQFSQNVLADEQAWSLVLDGEADLAGLPEPVRAAAAAAGEARGLPGRHVVTLARSSIEPFLQFSARRDLREEAMKAWSRRGESGGATDNRTIVAELIALRAEFARLMGYANFAEFSLEDRMAKRPSEVRALLDRVWPAAVARAAEERDALTALARAEGGNFALERWDWRYFTEKERKSRYDLDEAEVSAHLTLDNMIAAAFDTATRLFGLRFTERPDIPVYHPDVRAWEVTTRAGKHVGVFLGDYMARPSKRSGAWMSTFRTQHKLKGEVRPIVTNVMSCAKGAEGEPTLLSFDDARTLFHEFGHGLHGLLSDVTYPTLACTNVDLDFVELPSQLYEHWLSEPDVLGRFAIHHKTGKPMPARLIKRLAAARTFNQGFQTVEYTASAYLDMDLHSLADPSKLDVTAFETEVLDRLGMPAEIAPRHRIPHFQHITGGYGAGYYSYLWSEVMDADVFEAFRETGDVFDRSTATRLRKFIYAAGNRRDPLEAYIAFRGRKPEVEGLLKKRGLV